MNYKINEGKTVFAELSEQEAVILHMDSKRYFQMNETAQFIWKGLNENKSTETITNELSETFDVGTDTAQNDVDEFVQALSVEQFISAL